VVVPKFLPLVAMSKPVTVDIRASDVSVIRREFRLPLSFAHNGFLEFVSHGI
jgi:hypothetical protein